MIDARAAAGVPKRLALTDHTESSVRHEQCVDTSAPKIPIANNRVLRTEVIVLFIIGLTYGLSSTLKGPIFSGGMEPLAIARSLAATGAFANPFGAPTGPSAHTGPVFPLYLSVFLRLFSGAGAQSVALAVVASILHGLEIAFLPLLADIVFGTAEIGFLAGILSAIPCFRILPQWDSSLAGFVLITFCLATGASDWRPAGKKFVVGIMCALLLLLNPILAIPAAIWLAHVVRVRRWRYKSLALPLGVAILVCVPWLVRSYVLLGRVVPIRDNFGLELQVSNNDRAAPSIVANGAALESFHPSINPQEAAEVQRIGEIAYEDRKLRKALEWIASNPERFATLTIWRTLEFWFPAGEGFVSVGIGVITALSIPGVLLALKRKNLYARTLLWMLAIAPLPYYLVQSNLRYRMPLLWISLLFAAYAIESAVASVGHEKMEGVART